MAAEGTARPTPTPGGGGRIGGREGGRRGREVARGHSPERSLPASTRGVEERGEARPIRLKERRKSRPERKRDPLLWLREGEGGYCHPPAVAERAGGEGTTQHSSQGGKAHLGTGLRAWLVASWPSYNTLGQCSTQCSTDHPAGCLRVQVSPAAPQAGEGQGHLPSPWVWSLPSTWVLQWQPRPSHCPH